MKKAKAAVLLGALMISGTAVADLSTGLVAYYCFDDETNIGKDCSANGNNGSPTGQVGTVTGLLGKAASFGGYNNPASIHIPNSSSLQFNQDFSVAFAVKMTGFNGMDGWGNYSDFGAHSIFAKSHDRNGTTLMVGGDSTTGNLGTWVASYEWNNSISTPTPYAGVGKWVHLTYIFSNSQQKAQLYANGVLITTKDGFSQDFTSINSQDLYLGKFSDSWFPLNGALDEVRIYNRAITTAEVTALYQQGAIPTGNSIYSYIKDIAVKIRNNKIDDAVSVIPNMVGFLANHPYFKNTKIFKIGINGKIGTQLQAQIRDKFKLRPVDVTKMGIDAVVDYLIDSTSATVAKVTGNRWYGGATWFLMKQLYSIADAAYSSNGNYLILPVTFLDTQSSLLIDVLREDIKEFNILKNDFGGAKASEIRGEIIRARGFDLLQFYQEYFRAETQEEKTIILNDIATRQKELLSAYFSGDNIFLPSVSKIAKRVYADWLQHLPGNLIKEEFEDRARLYALVYKSEYDTAISAATFIFGTPIFSVDLIREKAKTDEGANNYLIEHGY